MGDSQARCWLLSVLYCFQLHIFFTLDTPDILAYPSHLTLSPGLVISQECSNALLYIYKPCVLSLSLISVLLQSQ